MCFSVISHIPRIPLILNEDEENIYDNEIFKRDFNEDFDDEYSHENMNEDIVFLKNLGIKNNILGVNFDTIPKMIARKKEILFLKYKRGVKLKKMFDEFIKSRKDFENLIGISKFNDSLLVAESRRLKAFERDKNIFLKLREMFVPPQTSTFQESDYVSQLKLYDIFPSSKLCSNRKIQQYLSNGFYEFDNFNLPFPSSS
jgi:hypothetical protein